MSCMLGIMDINYPFVEKEAVAIIEASSQMAPLLISQALYFDYRSALSCLIVVQLYHIISSWF